jgi:hypothetical protein
MRHSLSIPTCVGTPEEAYLWDAYFPSFAPLSRSSTLEALRKRKSWGLSSLFYALDEDVERVKKRVIHVHNPSCLVKAAVSNNCRIKKSKHKLSVDEDAVRNVIKAFLDELTSMSSCFNRHKCHFIKCGGTRKITDDNAHADECLLDVVLMTKNEQDTLYK